MRHISLLLVGILCSSVLYGMEKINATDSATSVAEQGTEIYVVSQYYPINTSTVKEKVSLSRLHVITDSLLQSGNVRSIDIQGYASPDGPYAVNSRLSLQRAKGIRSYLVNKLKVSPALITVSSEAEDWPGLQRGVEADYSVPSRSEVLRIIESTKSCESREQELKRLERGGPWRYLSKHIFPQLRRTVISFNCDTHKVTVCIPDEVAEEMVETEDPASTQEPAPADSLPIAESAIMEETEIIVEQPFLHHWYVKTNVPAWGMLWMNAAAEYDIASHWSVQLPVYYSGFNYFTSTRKYRTFTVAPELRWWPSKNNNGFFLGAHAAMAYYNVAFEGENRYQDHDGKTPALGGGLDLGYRFPLNADGNWLMEFSAGAGVYHLDYDIYKNVSNGLLKGRKKKTFVGLDNFAISIVYRFGKTKEEKGGKR